VLHVQIQQAQGAYRHCADAVAALDTYEHTQTDKHSTQARKQTQKQVQRACVQRFTHSATVLYA
jgi:hypothetical protein